MGLWTNTSYHHLRQWDELRQQTGGKLLCQIQDHPPILHPILSTRQWSGRDQQLHYTRQPVQEPRQREKQIGGETPKSAIGVQDYQPRPNRRNPVFITLWDRWKFF